MKYAWTAEFQCNLGNRKAWVYADTADEVRRLIESAHSVVCFYSIVRHEASKVLCYVDHT